MPYAGKYKDSVFFTGATIIYSFSIKFDPPDRAFDQVRSAEKRPNIYRRATYCLKYALSLSGK